MTRLPLATDLKTRIGATSTKDARQVNSYVEVKGDQTVVRKRPAAQGGIAVGTGTAQGGIGLTINGTPYFIGFWGDVLYSYSGSGTSWSSGTFYLQGDHVSVDFVDYYAVDDNAGNNPTSSTAHWSRTPTPAVLRYTTTPSGGSVSVSTSSSSTGSYPGPFTETQTWSVIAVAGGATLRSGTGIWISTVFDATLMPFPYFSFSNYVFNAANAASRRSADITAGLSIPAITSGYDYYLYNASATWNGSTYTGSGSFSPL